ncbi:MAG: hypothetical protein M3Y07_08870 [Acidobacteriota bacterium]|nr:hypothetical protein [Acidobacteriota bacterium]
MLELALALRLFTIREIHETSKDALAIVLSTGQMAHLRRDHRNYEYYEKVARRNMERRHPVGVSFEANGDVRQIVPADRDTVEHLENHGPDHVRVWFAGHDGLFALERTAPDFERIYQTLARSLKDKTYVWFAASLPSLTIQDVVAEGKM